MNQGDEHTETISPRITRNKDDSAYQYNEDPSKWRKKAWTNDEDQFLVKLVHKYGPQKWTTIAENMPGRIGKQCRERWHNHLNPDINKDQWSSNEEWILFLLHKNMGNQWATFTKQLKGRTDNAIKNHWNSAMRKKSAQYHQKYKKVKANLEGQKRSVKDIDKYLLERLDRLETVPELLLEETQATKATVPEDSFVKSTATIVHKKEEKEPKGEDTQKTAKKQVKKEETIFREETATKSKRATQPPLFGHHINTRLSQLSLFGAPSRQNMVSAFSLLEEAEPVVLEPQPSFNDISLEIDCAEDQEDENQDNMPQRQSSGFLGTRSGRINSRSSLPREQRKSTTSLAQNI